MSTQEKISDRLKRLREEQGLTQEGLAVALGFTRSYISQLEAGVKEAGPKFLRELARWESTLASKSGARRTLRSLRERAGFTLPKLARKVGYEVGVLQALEDGSARISQNLAEKLSKVLNCTVEELLSGSDHPPILQDGPAVLGTVGARPEIVLPPGVEARYVPLISWAQAGHMKSFSDEAYEYEGHVAFNVTDRKAIAVRIRGDSMSPQYSEGDVAILYPSFEPRNGDLTISKLTEASGGDVMFKIYHTRESGRRVVLTSYNPIYPPLEYKRDEFQWIYPVASVVKHLRR